MSILAVDVSPEDWNAAPYWQRDKTNSGRLMLVAKEEPMFKLGDTVKLVISMNAREQEVVEESTTANEKPIVKVCDRWYYADGDKAGNAVNGSTAYITKVVPC